MQWHIAEAQRLELHATLEEAIALLRRALEEPSEPRALAEVHFHLGRMLALQRSLAALGPDAALTKLLSAAHSRWGAAYAVASEGPREPTGWHQLA